ncbi:MAG: hypothetical protein JNL41_13225 [Phenylobacterium sp.]|uniref:hypothetical protein n=1 Tax=Phenylobacterium sp. TaxID=1871053 RepID=UPI001A599B55|nr:hypothetical protein [Phenylobacterium sp.]MBL8555237.1 hypothetical protein [Phenylobacterium sp.]
MQPIDYPKALGTAVLVLALNMLVTTAAIFAWSLLVDPGHEAAYYQAGAPKIAALTAPLGGAALLCLASWVLGRRRPGRHALLFAATIWAAYAVIDIAVGLPMATPAQLFTPVFAVSLGAGLLASLIGGSLAARRDAAAG